LRSNEGEMNAEVSNNPAEYRYELWADGELAGYTQYAMRRGRIAFLHTKVYESFEGMGGRLARAALDDARQGTGSSAVLPVHRGLHRAPPR
jgi:predicted GNAT family acetyltransferase